MRIRWKNLAFVSLCTQTYSGAIHSGRFLSPADEILGMVRSWLNGARWFALLLSVLAVHFSPALHLFFMRWKIHRNYCLKLPQIFQLRERERENLDRISCDFCRLSSFRPDESTPSPKYKRLFLIEKVRPLQCKLQVICSSRMFQIRGLQTHVNVARK